MKLRAIKSNLDVEKAELLVSGSVDTVKVVVDFSHHWDGLAKTIVFKIDKQHVYPEPLDAEDTVIIPSYVLKNPATELYISVYGSNVNSGVVLTTPYVKAGPIHKGGVEAGSSIPQAEDATVYDTILGYAADAGYKASAAMTSSAAAVLTSEEANERSKRTEAFIAQASSAALIEAEIERISAEEDRVLAEKQRAEEEARRVIRDVADTVWEIYDHTKTYIPGNKVSFNGSSYLNTSESTDCEPTDQEHWLLIAQRGEGYVEAGGMLAATYDPLGKARDVFAYVDAAVKALANRLNWLSSVYVPQAVAVTSWNGLIYAAQSAYYSGYDTALSGISETYNVPMNGFSFNLMEDEGVTPFSNFSTFKLKLRQAIGAAGNDAYTLTWDQVQYYIINGNFNIGLAEADAYGKANYWWYNGGTKLTGITPANIRPLLEAAKAAYGSGRKAKLNSLSEDEYAALNFRKTFNGQLFESKSEFANVLTALLGPSSGVVTWTWDQVQYGLIHASYKLNAESVYYWWKNGGDGTEQATNFDGGGTTDVQMRKFLDAAYRYSINGNIHAWDNLTDDILAASRLVRVDNGADTYDALPKFDITTGFDDINNGVSAIINAMIADKGQSGQAVPDMPNSPVYWWQMQYGLLTGEFVKWDDVTLEFPSDDEYWWRTKDARPTDIPTTPQEAFSKFVSDLIHAIESDGLESFADNLSINQLNLIGWEVPNDSWDALVPVSLRSLSPFLPLENFVSLRDIGLLKSLKSENFSWYQMQVALILLDIKNPYAAWDYWVNGGFEAEYKMRVPQAPAWVQEKWPCTSRTPLDNFLEALSDVVRGDFLNTEASVKNRADIRLLIDEHYVSTKMKILVGAAYGAPFFAEKTTDTVKNNAVTRLFYLSSVLKSNAPNEYYAADGTITLGWYQLQYYVFNPITGATEITGVVTERAAYEWFMDKLRATFRSKFVSFGIGADDDPSTGLPVWVVAPPSDLDLFLQEMLKYIHGGTGGTVTSTWNTVGAASAQAPFDAAVEAYFQPGKLNMRWRATTTSQIVSDFVQGMSGGDPIGTGLSGTKIRMRNLARALGIGAVANTKDYYRANRLSSTLRLTWYQLQYYCHNFNNITNLGIPIVVTAAAAYNYFHDPATGLFHVATPINDGIDWNPNPERYTGVLDTNGNDISAPPPSDLDMVLKAILAYAEDGNNSGGTTWVAPSGEPLDNLYSAIATYFVDGKLDFRYRTMTTTTDANQMLTSNTNTWLSTTQIRIRNVARSLGTNLENRGESAYYVPATQSSPARVRLTWYQLQHYVYNNFNPNPSDPLVSPAAAKSYYDAWLVEGEHTDWAPGTYSAMLDANGEDFVTL